MAVTFIQPIESQGKSTFGNNDKKPESKANIHRWLSSCGNNHKNSEKFHQREFDGLTHSPPNRVTATFNGPNALLNHYIFHPRPRPQEPMQCITSTRNQLSP